jgi:sugar lactone lactonase YvrE
MAWRILLAAAALVAAACDASDGTGGNGAPAAGDAAAPAPADLSGVAPAAADLAVADDLGGAPDLRPSDGDGGVVDVIHPIAGVMVATLAGAAESGSLDGDSATARFDNPVGIVLASDGLLYVTEYDGSRIRTVDAAGNTGTVVADVTTPETFACPFAIAVVNATELLVQTDCDTTGAKTDTSGTLWTVDVTTGTPRPLAQGLGRPRGLAMVAAHVACVSDRVHDTIATVDVTTGALTPLAGALDDPGYYDAAGNLARFTQPYGLIYLGGGSVAVADLGNHRLRRVDGHGVTTTLAGGSDVGTVDAATARAARFDAPKAVAVDAVGDLFVSDVGAHRIRRVRASGVVETVAGAGTAGFRDGAGLDAEFYGQEGLAVTSDGKTLFVADGNGGDGGPYHRIRVITIP